MTAKTPSNEIKISRFYEAPVPVVWDAWTDPKQVGHWWGPRGFTLTSHSHDLKTGGHWHYTMHGPDGVDYENRTLYLEVIKHEKMVYDHGGLNERKPLFRVTALFSAVKGGTRLDMTMTLPTPEAAEQTKQFIKKAGGNATWDRLNEYLVKQAANKEIFVINRSFDVSIETMYDLWTNPKHFPQWLPPTGFKMKFIKEDLRPGGKSFYQMTADNGSFTMYGLVEYVKMEKPHLLLYKQQFADEKGNISRHPMAPLWPETMLTTVKFTEEGPDRTRVTVMWEPYGQATAEEIGAFVKERPGMTVGWTGSFDKLDNYLEKA